MMALIANPAYFAANNCSADRALCDLGSGDSKLLFNVIDNSDSDNQLFNRIREEVSWSSMGHKGGLVPRLVAIQGEICTSSNTSGSIEPLYRHPADQQPVLQTFTPTIDTIRLALQERLNVRLNHALIQWYRGGRDFISEHADKTLDIERGSSVINYSVGASRDMQLRPKRDVRKQLLQSEAHEHDDLDGKHKISQRITLVHNSAFVLGWDTNLKMTHAIRQDRRRTAEKRVDELREEGQRISLTFRTVATFRRLQDGLLFGQGAPCKSESALLLQQSSADANDAAAMEAAAEETEKMLLAFGAENSSSDFDWEQYYGQGFSVLNMKLLQGGDVDTTATLTTL